MIWQEEAVGEYADPRLIALPGIESLRTAMWRGGPRPPLYYLTGCVPTEFAVGTAVFTMPASEWFMSPVGLIAGGVLAVPADGALGCAIMTGLPAGTAYTTSEISMSFLRPASPASGHFIARGRLIHGGRSLALSEAAVSDNTGRLLAHATSRCFAFPPIEQLPDYEELPPWEEPDYGIVAPFERPVEGEVLVQDVWDKMSGLEVLTAAIAGELPAPPIHHLTGGRVVEASEGKATFVMPATRWLTSPVGTVQGGFIAMLADAALACAVQTTIPAGSVYATVDIKVNLLRPVYGNGRDLTAYGEVAHRGRNLAVARGEVVNAEGKRIALMTGTTHVVEGRTWSFEERAEEVPSVEN